jgi:hypothetical protein
MSLRFVIILYFHQHVGHLSGPVLFRYMNFLPPPKDAICPSHLIVLNLITLLIFSSSTVCETPHDTLFYNFLLLPPLTSPNIYLNTLLSPQHLV